MSGPTSWSEQRERSNLRTLQLMRWITTRLGRRVARCVLHPITLYFMLFGGTAARQSARYLERALGRTPRWSERYRHIHHFAATVLDRVYLLQEHFDGFDVQLSGVEHLDAVLADGRGALLVGAHVGSFEALRALGQGWRGLKVAMVMYEDNARLINTTLQAVAPNAELHIIPLGRMESMLALREWLDAGGVAGLLADRTLPGQSERSGLHLLPFLGAPAPFSDGPFRLAALLRRQMVFMAGIYHGGNRYELRFLPVADFRARPRGTAAVDAAIHGAMARYVEILEDLCRETPYNWFNFFDFWAPVAAEPPVPAPQSDDGPRLAA